MESQHKAEWLEAMKNGIMSLIKKEVFELVPLPKGKKSIECWWMVKTKYFNGIIKRLEARLVAKGYLQRKGVDFNKTYSPSAQAETIRLVMSHMVKESWKSR